MEKKRSSRPTWTQIKELENVISELKKKYDILLKEHEQNHDGVVEESASMSKELTELRKKLIDLTIQNNTATKERDAWYEKYKQLQAEYDSLRNRGFWARLLNK